MQKEKPKKTPEELKAEHKAWEKDLERRAEEAVAKSKEQNPSQKTAELLRIRQIESLEEGGYIDAEIETEKPRDTQEQELREQELLELRKLKDEGWEVVETFYDKASVGVKDTPPGWKMMVKSFGTTHHVLRKKMPAQ